MSCSNSYTFCLHVSLNLHVWIRIHKAPEYGSNTDPDPQHWKLVYCSCNKRTASVRPKHVQARNTTGRGVCSQQSSGTIRGVRTTRATPYFTTPPLDSDPHYFELIRIRASNQKCTVFTPTWRRNRWSRRLSRGRWCDWPPAASRP